MKKRIISLLLSAVMLFSLLPTTAMAGGGIAYIERSWNGNEVTASEKTCTSFSFVSNSSTTWNAGWYVVNANTTISSAITVSGDVHLILCDNVTLTAQNGVIVNGKGTNSLTIYGQSGDSGKLITTGSSSAPYGAGIGGGGGYTTGDLKCGTVTIHGGTVNATGSEYGAGIGGGISGAGGTVTIYGGKVTGTAPKFGAGIGGGMDGAGGTVTIYGGEVTANGHNNAGIDGGNNTVTIFGGTIKATSNDGGSIRGKVTVNGGAVTAISNGGTEGTGIGGDALTVNGGTVTATGKNYGAGISSSAVTVNGGKVTATGGEWGPGISGGTLTVTGGEVFATGKDDCTGIASAVTVNGGKVTAVGGNNRSPAGISGSVSFGENFVGGVRAGASEDEAVNMTKQAYTEDHSANYVTMPVDAPTVATMDEILEKVSEVSGAISNWDGETPDDYFASYYGEPSFSDFVGSLTDEQTPDFDVNGKVYTISFGETYVFTVTLNSDGDVTKVDFYNIDLDESSSFIDISAIELPGSEIIDLVDAVSARLICTDEGWEGKSFEYRLDGETFRSKLLRDWSDSCTYKVSDDTYTWDLGGGNVFIVRFENEEVSTLTRTYFDWAYEEDVAEHYVYQEEQHSGAYEAFMELAKDFSDYACKACRIPRGSREIPYADFLQALDAITDCTKEYFTNNCTKNEDDFGKGTYHAYVGENEVRIRVNNDYNYYSVVFVPFHYYEYYDHFPELLEMSAEDLEGLINTPEAERTEDILEILELVEMFDEARYAPNCTACKMVRDPKDVYNTWLIGKYNGGDKSKLVYVAPAGEAKIENEEAFLAELAEVWDGETEYEAEVDDTSVTFTFTDGEDEVVLKVMVKEEPAISTKEEFLATLEGKYFYGDYSGRIVFYDDGYFYGAEIWNYQGLSITTYKESVESFEFVRNVKIVNNDDTIYKYALRMETDSSTTPYRYLAVNVDDNGNINAVASLLAEGIMLNPLTDNKGEVKTAEELKLSTSGEFLEKIEKKYIDDNYNTIKVDNGVLKLFDDDGELETTFSNYKLVFPISNNRLFVLVEDAKGEIRYIMANLDEDGKITSLKYNNNTFEIQSETAASLEKLEGKYFYCEEYSDEDFTLNDSVIYFKDGKIYQVAYSVNGNSVANTVDIKSYVTINQGDFGEDYAEFANYNQILTDEGSNKIAIKYDEQGEVSKIYVIIGNKMKCEAEVTGSLTFADFSTDLLGKINKELKATFSGFDLDMKVEEGKLNVYLGTMLMESIGVDEMVLFVKLSNNRMMGIYDSKYFSDYVPVNVTCNASGNVIGILLNNMLDFKVPEEQHSAHDGIEFEPWVSAEHDGALLPNVAGNWYLTEDVSLITTWSAPEGETNLCLNGKMLSLSGSRIKIPESATLNLYDCGNDAHEGYLDKYLWTRGTGGEGTTAKTIYGGIIYPEYYGEWNQKAYYPIQVDGTFTMYGGTIAGVTDTQGLGFSAAVTSITAGKGHFNMYGGAITGNTYTNGMYFANHNLNYGIIDPGKLESFTVGKNAVIDENYVIGYELVGGVYTPVYAKGNVIISDTKVIKIATGSNAPTEKMHVGVRSVTAPALGTPVVFTGANAGENDASRFESNMEGIHIERRKNNALYLCVEDEPAYVPCTCIDHKEKQNGQAATCTEDGWNDYYKCTTCETLYSDAAMTNEITDLEAWKIGDGKLGKTGHNFVYSASGTDIIASCTNAGCPDGKVTLSLTANGGTYDGTAKVATLTNLASFTDATGATVGSIEYYKGTTTKLEAAPKDAGNYTAKVTVTYGENETVTAVKNFTVEKAEQTITASATQLFTYGDTGKAVSAKATGALSYAVKSGDSVSVDAETGALTIHKVGDTVITVTAAETDNYKAATKDVTVTVGAKIIDMPTATSTDFVYNGKEQTYLPVGFDADTMNITGNKQTNANETGYTVSVIPKANYAWSTEGECKFTWKIGRKTAELQWTTPSDLVYSNSAKVPTVAVTNLESGDSCTVTAGLTAENDNINVGTFTFTATALSNGNYKLPDDVTSPEYTITKTSQDAPAEGEGYTVDYVNEKITPDSGYEVSTGSGDDFATGKLSGETDIVFGTTYYVRKVEDNNHNASEETPFSFTRPAAPAASAFTMTGEIVENKKDGSFSGITAAMEYSTDNGTTWISGPKTLTGLSNETVKVRYKATTAAFKSSEYSYTFTASTAKLTVNINGTETQIAYGKKLSRPDPDPTRTGYTFGGWYVDENCTQAWNFAVDTVTEDMTLYPKWIENAVQKAVITGNVTEDSSNVIGATVELFLGTVKVAATVTKDDPAGDYSFDNVENGVYNIVVTKGDKTKTEMVTVDTADNFEKNVDLPNKAVSSVVEHTGEEIANAKSDISQTVVGGLDEIAKNTSVSGTDKVTIKLTVEPKAESEVTGASDIKALAGSGKKVEFLDLSLREITTTDSDELIKNIGNTNDTILTIVIPFDFSGVNVSSVMILRNHGSSEKLTKNPADGQEGFTVNAAEGTITLYAMKFSDYAVAYAEQSSHGGHSGGSYTPGHTVTSDLKNVTKVTIDGKVVDSRYYTVSGGNIILSGEFMKTLANGKHTVKLYDGAKVATGIMTVSGNVAVISAATGDMGVALYAALSVSSILGMGWLGKKKRGGE